VVIYQTKRFDVTVGVPPGDEIKHNIYLVTNRNYGVVEFAHNSYHYIREWCQEMEKAMDAFENHVDDDDEEESLGALKAYN
jgi:hypothetical protein